VYRNVTVSALTLLLLYCYGNLLGPCGVDYYLHTLAYNAAAAAADAAFCIAADEFLLVRLHFQHTHKHAPWLGKMTVRTYRIKII